MKVVIFDLDGTLALIDHRRHWVTKPDFNEVHDKGFKLFPHDPITVTPVENYQALLEYLKTNFHDWEPNWDKFYAECVNDLPNDPIILLYKTLKHVVKMKCYIFSGREDSVRKETLLWLSNQHIFPNDDELLMRPKGDFTPDQELKKKWLYELVKANVFRKEDIVFTVDDRQKVVDMWRAEGLTCLQVAPGKF